MTPDANKTRATTLAQLPAVLLPHPGTQRKGVRSAYVV